MEQQKLPNVTLAIVLAIFSYLCCCFSAGIGGILLGGIAFFILKKDEKKYSENPDLFSNYSSLKTAKILAIIGMVLGVIVLIWTIYSISNAGGISGYITQVCDAYAEMGIEAPFCD
jgi:hypothetical protein